jgi:hypothetical protein
MRARRFGGVAMRAGVVQVAAQQIEAPGVVLEPTCNRRTRLTCFQADGAKARCPTLLREIMQPDDLVGQRHAGLLAFLALGRLK